MTPRSFQLPRTLAALALVPAVLSPLLLAPHYGRPRELALLLALTAGALVVAATLAYERAWSLEAPSGSRAEPENEHMDEFLLRAGKLAHDLRNSQLVALGNAQELLDRSEEGSEDRQLLVEIIDAVHASVALADGVMRGTDTRSGGALDLGAVAERACERLRPALPPGVGLEVDARAGAWVEGSSLPISRMTENLIVNAIEAQAERGGIVRVEAAPNATHGLAQLQVHDTGSGLSPQHSERAFEPYFTTKDGGRGLGLAVVRETIHAHAGRVQVDSDPSGTRFRVDLPLAEGPRSDPQPQAPSPHRDRLPQPDPARS